MTLLSRARRACALAGAAALATAALAGAPASSAPASPSRAPQPEAASVPAPPTPLVIDTDGAAPVLNRDDYVAGTMQLGGLTHRMEMKGRGNSTWKWPKKPYKIKLESDAGLLGMPEADEWVLLANFADRSALRTQLAMGLASQTRLPWTPHTRYVDVVVNGQSLGLYLLTEQVELNDTRVVVPDDGHLLEIDQRFRQTKDPGFRSARGTPVAFKDPDEVDAAQRRRVKGAVKEFEKVLYGPRFADPEKGYPAYVDVDTFVDWYLVEELFRNQDSNFHSSVFVTWSPEGLFAMGPVWDFDLSAGNKWRSGTTPQGWHTRLGTHWLARMFEDPAFTAKVKARWDELRPLADRMVAEIPDAAGVIRASAQADWALWHRGDGQVDGTVHADSFDGEVGFLRTWLQQRAEWMSIPEVVVGRTRMQVRESRGTAWVPVRLLGSTDRTVRVDYAAAPGSATRGRDFELADGTLVFAPGETVKSIPVTLVDDGIRERTETIPVALTKIEGGAILGTPTRLTVRVDPSDQRLDAMVRAAGKRGFSGRGLQNAGGDGQAWVSRATRGATRTFQVRVVNRGNVRNAFRLQAARPAAGLRVRYRLGSRDVTGKVRSSRGLKVRVRPGRHADLTAVVTVRRGSRASGQRRAGLVTATWRGDSTVVDGVQPVVLLP